MGLVDSWREQLESMKAAVERTDGGKVVDPVSVRACVLGDGWLPHTARLMGDEVQKGRSREAQATALEYGLLPNSRSSFASVAHLVAAVATLVSKRRNLNLQLLCDGASEKWNLLEEGSTEQRSCPADGHPVHTAITCLHSHRENAERMNYSEARRLGLPLGSGNLGATCKSLCVLPNPDYFAN